MQLQAKGRGGGVLNGCDLHIYHINSCVEPRGDREGKGLCERAR